MRFFVQLYSSGQDVDRLRASRGPSAVAELFALSIYLSAFWVNSGYWFFHGCLSLPVLEENQ